MTTTTTVEEYVIQYDFLHSVLSMCKLNALKLNMAELKEAELKND